MSNNLNQKHEAHWQGVEDYFNNLPPQLYQQGMLLRNKLAIQYSETGVFADILSRVEYYPLLNITSWLLDDFNFPEGEVRNQFEKILFSGNLFIFTSIYTQNLILDEDLIFDREYLLLASLLSRQADKYFSQIFPIDSIFWNYHQKSWKAYAEARLICWKNYSEFHEVASSNLLLQRVDLLAPFQLIPIAVAILGNREQDLQKLIKLFDDLHTIQTIINDLGNLPLDLKRRKLTYPLIKTYSDLGVPLTKEYTPESMLMTMAFSGTFSKIADDCQTLIDECIAGAADLRLDRLGAYFSSLELSMQNRLNTYSWMEKKGDDIGGAKSAGISLETVPRGKLDSLSKAVIMAEAYLLSDLEFQEAWEVHRWGMIDDAVVISRFPAGLITEVLSSQGHDLTEQVEAFFLFARQSNFSYYDHKKLSYADSDTLGVLLNLYEYSPNQITHREILEIPLGWMETSVEKSGRIPVWTRGVNDSGIDESRPVRLLGEDCGSIEAKLLLGLCGYDWERYQEIIQSSARQLLKRFTEQGSGITVNYPRLYCLWRVGQLLTSLVSYPISEELEEIVNQANEIYPQYLEQEINQYRITPQEAAFLILACLDSSNEKMLDHKWVSILISNHRSDGSWYGEPIFFVPNNGSYTTWHSSHQLTTTFCYLALKVFEKHQYLNS